MVVHVLYSHFVTWPLILERNIWKILQIQVILQFIDIYVKMLA